MATLTKIANRLAASSGATVAGGAEKTLAFGTQFQIHFGVKDGKIVITNSGGAVSPARQERYSLARKLTGGQEAEALAAYDAVEA